VLETPWQWPHQAATQLFASLQNGAPNPIRPASDFRGAGGFTYSSQRCRSARTSQPIKIFFLNCSNPKFTVASSVSDNLQLKTNN
jgi:hypothetical protein